MCSQRRASTNQNAELEQIAATSAVIAAATG
jgi:hypothetical protein